MRFRGDRTRIAVVGCAYQMPGVAGAGFFEALLAGRDLVTSVAPGRWVSEPFLHPRKSQPGTAYTFAAGSLGDVSGFDAAFFGISPREAEQMDPQQRLLLEMAWEAFEDAGIRPSSVRGGRWGTYIGISSLDYAYRRADDLGGVDATTMTGNTGSIAANRLSYVFDLHGPSMAIDTACSSSLVALHQACQSIRCGESDAAVVGGISLHLHPYAFVGFSKASMLSRHGRCSVFDERGDGYVRSEGGAVVLLKPLAQALAEGNRVLGVILETGVNNDGRKTGLTVPSHSAQAALLREVYERSGIDPAEIDYIEAHGTGTAVGDPIEARGIGEALGQRRPRSEPLPVGSVKSNIGHLEAASGMAGLVKLLHVLVHRRVPPNIHLDKPNPNIDFAGLNLAPVVSTLPLREHGRVVAGVSAFGFGGTNAHAVLTSFESPRSRVAAPAAQRVPLSLSARSPAALRETARRMAAFLRERTDLAEYDIAYSAVHTRDIHPHRLLAEAEHRDALAAVLERFAETGSEEGLSTGTFRREASGPAFIYSGNGSQWLGMGVQLLDEEAIFRETVEHIDALYVKRSGRSLMAELRAPPTESRLEYTEVAQPALFAVQVGLTRLLESQGIRPLATCGHSVGEVAAAWASGALTLEAAVQVIHQRSEHQALTRGKGTMTAIELGEAEIAPLLKSLGLSDSIVVAAVNTESAVTLAGPTAAMARVEAALGRARVGFRRLPLEYAFHSGAMDPIRASLTRSLAELASAPSAVPLYSTVTGMRLEGNELCAEHWWRNVREPVRFAAAVREMLNAGINTFLEIGPRPALSTYLGAIAKARQTAAFVLPSLTVARAGRERLRWIARQLELSGAIERLPDEFPVPGQMVDLPRYAWQHERYWHPPTLESSGLLTRESVHPLLGHAVPGQALQWENSLDTLRIPALADHVVGGAAVFPAAGFVEMALAAAALRWPDSPPVIEDLEIVAPLLLDAEHTRVVRLRLEPEEGCFTITSRDLNTADWRTHVVGRLVESAVLTSVAALPAVRGAPQISAPEHYALARSAGLEYGPAFQSVAGAWVGANAIVGSMTTPAAGADLRQHTLLDLASLDGAFQLLLDASQGASAKACMQAFLPVRIERLELLRPRASVAVARVVPAPTRHRTGRSLLADFTLYAVSGEAIAVARGVRFRASSLRRPAAEPGRWIVTNMVPMPRREAGRALSLPPLEETVQRCTSVLHTPARSATRRRFAQQVEPLLDALCAAFAERAVREIKGGAQASAAELAAPLQIEAQHEPLLRALEQMLTEDGIALQSEAALPEPVEIWTSLIADYPEYATLFARVGSAGLNLRARLTSNAPPEAPVREGEASAFSWVETCTQHDAVALFEAVRQALEHSARAQLPGGRLRVLHLINVPPPEELGAAALPLADPEHCEVVIGARSRAALNQLRVGYPHSKRAAVQVVDIDAREFRVPDALVAGFDVIVLTEGFASAPDAQVRLKNVRRLLLDHGELIALEQHPSRASDLVFGLAGEWWRQQRTAQGEGLLHSRLRSPEHWGAALHEAGFPEVRTALDSPEGSTGPYVLIARAAVRVAESETSATPAARTWLIARDETGYSAELGAALERQLRAHGHRSITLFAAREYEMRGDRFALDTASPAHWARLIDDLQRLRIEPHAWIHLCGLRSADRSSSGANLLAVQEARAATLVAWLRASARAALRTECWVVGGADRLCDAALKGLARVAMQEFADCRVRWMELPEATQHERLAARVLNELFEPDSEDEVQLTDTGRFVPRIMSSPGLPAEPPVPSAQVNSARASFRLDFPYPGSFRNLTWRDRPGDGSGPLAGDELEIEVHAAGLNFRDVMYALGVLPDEALEEGFCGPNLGMELAGVVSRVGAQVELRAGDEVIAIAPGAFADTVRTRSYAVVRKPPEWSFAAAATVPTVFFTAYYALVELARIRASERVLIHGAAGAVGIAALQIARHLGAEVFATAGTPEKRDFVRLLGADHVFDSRSLGFADEILQVTAGSGVDVVLNSLAGEAMRRNLRVLRPFGRMIELGKRDFYENSRLALRPFRNNISYFGLDADQLIAQRPEVAQRVLTELMGLFAGGILHPLPHRAFSAGDVELAFRHMQASRHIGKIVLEFPREFAPCAASAAPAAAPVLRSDATYLVTGGLTGLGLRTAWWLIERGARHLALLSRRGAATPDAQAALREFAAAGVTARAIACDASDPEALSAALAQIDAQLPPLKGVVHAAAVIEDALIREIERGELKRVLAAKVGGAWQLHEATRDRGLELFVLYSSATTLFGNPGQGAYVAANMALEALAAERIAQGLPATCVALGPIGDVGYLSRHASIRDALVSRIGGRALKADDALRALEQALSSKAQPAGFLELDWNVLGRFLPAARAPKFSELARQDESGGAAQEPAGELRRTLAALPAAELGAALIELVRSELAQILRLAPERIGVSAPLAELGMDSLMAVELATSLHARIGVELSAFSLGEVPTVERIAARLARELRPESGEYDGPSPETQGARGPEGALTEQVRLMAAQHGSELTEQLVTAVSLDAANARSSLTRREAS